MAELAKLDPIAHELAEIGKGNGWLDSYDPDRGLEAITEAELREAFWRVAKDATQLAKAIAEKLLAQAKYVVWHDSVPGHGKHGGDRKSDQVSVLKLENVPDAVTIHRWRKAFTIKETNLTTVCKIKVQCRIDDAALRAIRICEQEKTGTVRGTEGTGEFELYTPAVYIAAVKGVLGDIDLDPASCDEAQKTIQAKCYFTEGALEREWKGRVFLNPPYHRQLLPAFVSKLVAEFRAGNTKAAILLTNNCTDTEWFAEAHTACRAICFTRGRIRFNRPSGEEVAPTQGQAFFYFGDNIKKFAVVFHEIGIGVKPCW